MRQAKGAGLWQRQDTGRELGLPCQCLLDWPANTKVCWHSAAACYAAGRLQSGVRPTWRLGSCRSRVKQHIKCSYRLCQCTRQSYRDIRAVLFLHRVVCAVPPTIVLLHCHTSCIIHHHQMCRRYDSWATLQCYPSGPLTFPARHL